MLDFLKQLTDPQSIIHYGGLALLLFVIFAETGLLIGFFLPGDSLIFISGMICISKPEVLDLDLLPLIFASSGVAIIGNIAGYWFGKRVGSSLFDKKDSLVFKKKYLILTQKFYNRHGGKALILGRFLPIVRTFAPILAGIIKIKFKQFMLYNIIGAFLWIGILTSLGYYLGTYEWVQNHIGYIVIALIVITTIPLLLSYYKNKTTKSH